MEESHRDWSKTTFNSSKLNYVHVESRLVGFDESNLQTGVTPKVVVKIESVHQLEASPKNIIGRVAVGAGTPLYR
jgi:hypothetical protein